MRSVIQIIVATPILGASILAFALLTTSCVVPKHAPLAPPVSLAAPKIPQSLVAGQILYELRDGKLVLGVNLRGIGLTTRSSQLTTLNATQRDVSLSEVLSMVGASTSACEAEGHTFAPVNEPWYQGEQDTLVGEDVSVVLTGVTTEAVDSRQLASLYAHEHAQRPTKVPWSGDSKDASNPNATENAFVVTRASTAREVKLSFQVRKNAAFPKTQNFVYALVKTAIPARAVLTEIVRACAPHATSRDLPDDGIEFAATFAAPRATGVELARLTGSWPAITSETQVQTALRLYDSSRLPQPTWQREPAPGATGIWGSTPSLAVTMLAATKDEPEWYRFKYCSEGTCYGMITAPMEFDSEGKPYQDPNHRGTGCQAVAQPGVIATVTAAFKAFFLRPIMQRELVLFFGLPPNPAGTFDDYTSAQIKKQPEELGNMPKPEPKATKIWIYEYDCEGGIAVLKPSDQLTHLEVDGHLKGWMLVH